MTQLRQLHLQFSLKAPRALGEYIQNQTAAIQHAALQASFQIALLARTEQGAYYDDVGPVLLNAPPEVLNLAFAQ